MSHDDEEATYVPFGKQFWHDAYREERQRLVEIAKTALDVECTCAYVPFGDPRYNLKARKADPECPEHSMIDQDEDGADAAFDVIKERDW